MNSNSELTIQEFVSLLWEQFSLQNFLTKGTEQFKPETTSDLLQYGHIKGWLEDQDQVYCNQIIDKRTAARILHQFMKIQLNQKDIQNISEAKILKDLYSCRVCANHVAQIFLKKIMDCEEIELNGERGFIFNMLKPVTRKEADSSILKMFDYSINFAILSHQASNSGSSF